MTTSPFSVPSPPNVTTTLPSIIRIEEGRPLRLEVVVFGYLDVSVSWNRSTLGLPSEAAITGTGGQSPPDSEQPGRYTSILSIPSVQLNDGGEYVCTASNQGGSGQIDFRVVVLRPAAATIVESSPSPVLAVQGGRLVIFCRAQGNPAPGLVWQDPIGRTIAERMGSDVLGDDIVEVLLQHEITPVAVDDAGQYVCEASNTIGSAQATVNVVVQSRRFTSLNAALW